MAPTDAHRPTDHQGVLAHLAEGNRRFADGSVERPRQDTAHRATLTGGQAPMAAVLGCSDSRAAAEMLFDQGLGDLFVVRTAGHALGTDPSTAVASLEYAVAHLGVRVLYVLGHDACGAVAATVADLQGAAPLDGSMPVLAAETSAHLDPEDPARDAVERHVAGTMRDLPQRSTVLADAISRGDLVIVGGVYGLADGTVRPVQAAAEAISR